MSFLSTILNFFGTKSQRDMKELAPNVQQILATHSTVSDLSNDELRNKTIEFKTKINNTIKIFDDQINDLREKIDSEKNRDFQEKIYKEIDDIKKETLVVTLLTHLKHGYQKMI